MPHKMLCACLKCNKYQQNNFDFINQMHNTLSKKREIYVLWLENNSRNKSEKVFWSMLC